MFRYLKSVVSYFWTEDDADLTVEDAFNVLQHSLESEIDAPDTVPIVCDEDDYSCYHKTGTITSTDDNSYCIDNKYKFESPLLNLAVGMQVSFTIYTTAKEVKVTDVVIVDDWLCDDRGNDKSSWCLRSLITKVSKRSGREITVTPGDKIIDLNTVASEFIPIVGDWVELQAKVELDENISDLFGKILEVEKIRPLRPRILEGWIKQWCHKTKTGVIDRVVFFNHDALISGYVPIVGDKVVTEVIESDQGRYTYRSLKIVPETHSSNIEGSLPKNISCKFDNEKENVVISSDIFINARKLGETHKFLIEIWNKSKEDVVLLNVKVPGTASQCKIIKPTILDEIIIGSGVTFNFEGSWTVTAIGKARELILFTFQDCCIGRWITVNFETQNSEHQQTRYANRGSLLLAKGHFKQNNDMVRGPKTNVPPRFISVRLPEYPVPLKLLNILLKSWEKKTFQELLQELTITKRCLSLPLTFNIYEDRFHTLLHLEEISSLIAIKNYSRDRVCFIRNADCLMLEFDNLAEKRPSLMIGDKIIAKDSYNSDATEYEGVIQKVGAKHIYLKFDPSFHDTYNGEDMAIIAVASRTTYRRMHQAVGLAIRNLGNSFLFPTKVTEAKPQVNFTYDQYPNDSKELNGLNTSLERKQNRAEKVLEALRKHALSNGVVETDESKVPEDLPVKSQLLLDVPEETKSKRFSKTTPRSPQPAIQPLLKLEWYNKNLNYYQKEAVRNILLGAARPLPYIIFGPPGTGKTITLVETILQILRLIPHSRLIVATPSNSAADLIALRLIDSGVLKPGDLIRLVAYRCVAADTLPLKLIPYSATADISSERSRAQYSRVTDSGLTLGCNSSVIGRHRITIATCSTIGSLMNMAFTKGHFTHVIIDEAGQATEPEALIPFTLLDTLSGQIILAGDPLQLGPIVTSKSALEYGLQETYLDRMINRFPYLRDHEGFPETGGFDPRLVTRLVYNYRSLPDILQLPSDMFYDGELISMISPTDSAEIKLLNSVKEILPKGSPPPSVVFHDVIGENYQTSDSPSWYNPNEASQIFFYVNELYRLGLKSSDIGIISPYSKQVKQIRALLTEAEFDLPKVGTVEEFQGQEFMVIFLSTVRSSEQFREFDLTYNLGFLCNPRRLNVAITRARALMIIVGNLNLLAADLHWRNVIKYCIDNGGRCGSTFNC